MKYKVGIEKKATKSKQIAIKSECLHLSITAPVAMVMRTVAMIITAKNLKGFSFKTLPSLFKNFLCSLKETLSNLLTKKGTTIMVSQSKAEAKYICISEAKKELDIPTVINSQNIRFQKLSLFSLALTKFIIVSIICSIKSSITYFDKSYQVILETARILLYLCLFSVFPVSKNTLADSNVNKAHFDKSLNIEAFISEIENEYNIPKNLLLSIAKVESDVSPLALNKEGEAIIVKSKEEALKFVKESLAQGIRNIDIGVMQINYRYHGENFINIEDILDPAQNVIYAAKLLCKLYKKHETWHKAVRYYHSATKVHHEKYSKKILVSWLGT